MNDLMRLTNNNIPEDQRVEHEIQVKLDSDPIKQKTRGIPYSFREDFKKTILEMKAAGMIIDSKSPWCSPVRLVKKKDGTIRVCVDFRKVNSVTIKDAYPIPKIEDLFTYLTGAFVFSTLDLASGYYQVRMKPESQQYTAFSCEFGFYEYVVMPMGLTNACATFQRLMNGVLDGLLGKCCLVYLDDIIIFSNNAEEHLQHVKLVSQRLRNHNLKIKLSKCKFAQTQVEYLSHIISNGCIKPNPLKIASVTDFKRPTNVKSVQSFLGLVSYYRKFIKDCANLCSPLICLTTKPKAFEWTDSCEYAFKLLKSMLVSVDNVLILPDYEQPFRVEADASKFGVGGVLSQQREGQWKPVAYFSKHLSKTESNYSASEREMLAIVLSVERFKQYVYGREFVILSDHQPLKYLLTADVPDARLARLLNRLRIYNYTIDYRMGSKHGNADALSRMLNEDDLAPLVDNLDEDNNIVINAIHLQSDAMNREQLRDETLKWLYDLKQQFRRTGIKPVVTTFDTIEAKSLYSQWNRIYVFNDNLFREFVDTDDHIIYQYIVPFDQRDFILNQCHDSVLSGHLGFEKTRDRLVRKFYWYNQLKDIEHYVRTCLVCQQIKTPQRYNNAPMVPILPSRPGELLTTDLMGPLPRSEGGNLYILVVIDHFTKWVELFAMDKITAKDVAKNLMLVFLRHGIPETILSDQGTNYQAALMAELCELLDIHKVRTSPYHPQCDGLSERFNRSIQAMIASYVNSNHKNWDELLPTLAFAYNTATHSSTKVSPFQVVYGRLPKVPLDLMCPQVKLELFLTPETYVTEVQRGFLSAYEQVSANRDVKMNRNKIHHDRTVRAANFELHDLVWVLDTTVKKGLSNKFTRKWTGPYKILAKINDVNYELQPVKKRGKKLVMHLNRLQKCFTRNYVNVTNFKEMLAKPKRSTVPPNANLDQSIFTQESSPPVIVEEIDDFHMPLYEPPLPLFEENEIDDLIDEIGGLGGDVAEIESDLDDYWDDMDEQLIESQVMDEGYELNPYYQRQLDDEPDSGVLRKSTRVKKPIVRFAN